MKRRHFFATLLAFVLMLSVFPMTSASAYYRESVCINRNGSIISDVDAYLDDDINVRVSSWEDLLKIFPKELSRGDVIAYDPDDGILVKDFAYDFGYECYLRTYYDNDRTFYYTLYIYTDKNNNTGSNILGSNLPSSDYEYPEVYINGVYTPMSSFWQYVQLDFSQYGSTVFSGNRIYLNNDGNSPVEVMVNGDLVHFPDQQPIVVNPGRTMVPVRTIAEMINCKVEWNSNLKCAEITQGKSMIRIYPGNTTFYFNGKAYQMDVNPFVLNGRTMVPLRFIAEGFGYTVDFQSEDVLTVYLTSR